MLVWGRTHSSARSSPDPQVLRDDEEMNWFEFDVPVRWFVAVVALVTILIGVYALERRRRKGSKL